MERPVLPPGDGDLHPNSDSDSDDDEFRIAQSVTNDLQADVDAEVEARNLQYDNLIRAGKTAEAAFKGITATYHVKTYAKNLMKLTFNVEYLCWYKLTEQGGGSKKVMPPSHYGLILGS